MRRLSTFVTPVLLTACVSSPPIEPIRPLQIDGMTLITEGADTETSLVRQMGDGRVVYCETPGSDAVATRNSGLTLGAILGPENDSIGENRSQGAVALGGRSAEVLIARDLIYRACELAANVNASPDDTLKIYERFLIAIERIAALVNSKGEEPAALGDFEPMVNGTPNSSFRAEFGTGDEIRSEDDEDWPADAEEGP